MIKMSSLSSSASMYSPSPPALLISNWHPSFLTPVGTHRSAHLTPSKGRRSKKTRQEEANNEASSEVPPAPEIMAHVDVGLANISRNLQSRSSTDSPQYSVVFVARSSQSSSFHCHFPQMVAVASNSTPSSPAIRLVGFSKACEGRLSVALGIPRVSSIGLREGAPQAKGLIDYVREHVEPIDIAWLPQARAAQYQETKIDAVPTKIGTAKAKAKRPAASHGEP
jgi:ribonuclease P/MRP protein subunit POP3